MFLREKHRVFRSCGGLGQSMLPLLSRSSRRGIAVPAGLATKKPKVVIIGCGWAGFRCAVDIDKRKYDVKLVSPRNHFLFTPLLPSTAVGTLEFRCIQEPVRTIPHLRYYQATCSNISLLDKKLHCVDVFNDQSQFDVDFDILVYAAGMETNTFGCRGVYNNKHVFFLKQLAHSRAIRNRMIECFERASAPSVSDWERRRLLTFVVVGGGPTSIEFAAEVHDFLSKDVSRWYPELLPDVRVKVIEASGSIMGSFHRKLAAYTERLFASRRVEVITDTSVKEIKENVALLSSGEELAFGLMVWSTGVKPVELSDAMGNHGDGDGVTRTQQQLPPPLNHKNDHVYSVAKTRNGRLLVSEHLRLLHHSSVGDSNLTGTGNGSSASASVSAMGAIPLVPSDQALVFALGDCAADQKKALPPLAQVAMQQGIYMAKLLNDIDVTSSIAMVDAVDAYPPFRYGHLGSMASVGDWKGVYDSSSIGSASPGPSPVRPGHDDGSASSSSLLSSFIPSTKGFAAFLLWRAAYWTRAVSLSNKMLILMYWFKSAVFGRDISRF